MNQYVCRTRCTPFIPRSVAPGLIVKSGQQEIQCKLQGNNWSGLLNKRGARRRSNSHNAGMWTRCIVGGRARANCCLALGYCRSRAIPVVRCGILQRCRLLRPGVRRQQLQELRYPGQLERRVSDSGQPSRSRELPLCKSSASSPMIFCLIRHRSSLEIKLMLKRTSE